MWNGLIDRHPEVIVRCRSVEDVQEAIAVARRDGLPLAVRGGGHNVAGTGVVDGGLVIDMRGLGDVTVEVARQRIRAGGGTRYRQLDAAAQARGFVTPGGVFSGTGIGGIAPRAIVTSSGRARRGATSAGSARRASASTSRASARSAR